MNKEKLKQHTENKIEEAFIDLCEKYPLMDISISNICECSDVSRSTFYRFFKDKDDLMKTIEKEYMEKLKEISTDFFRISYADYLADCHAYDSALQKIWEYHYETRKTCRMLLSSNGDPHFTYLMYAYVESAYLHILKSANRNFGPYQDAIIRFQVNGILSLLFDLLGKDKFSPDIFPVLTKLFVNLPLDNFIL